jgi:hypothetical protein
LKEVLVFGAIFIFSTILGMLGSYYQQKAIEKEIQSELAMTEKIIYFSLDYKISSLISSIFFLSFFITYAIFQPLTLKIMIELSLIAFLSILSIYWMIQSYFVKISFNEHDLSISSPMKKDRKIPLSSLRSYRFSEFNETHVFNTDHHGVIKLSSHLRGLTNFFVLLEKKQKDLNETLRAQLRFRNLND